MSERLIDSLKINLSMAGAGTLYPGVTLGNSSAGKAVSKLSYFNIALLFSHRMQTLF